MSRFWHAPDVTPDLGDQGFLTDPTSDYGSFANATLKPLSSLASERVLILIGEPGSGKSTELHREYERVKFEEQAGGDCFWIDLCTVATDIALRQLFHSPELETSIRENREVTLNIDSLDECLLHIEVAVPVILDEANKLPQGRTKVRIACRAADLPTAFPQQLGTCISVEPKVLRIAPLRRSDVLNAAAGARVPDPTAFVAQLVAENVVALAIVPITLKLLIETYSQNGTLPALRRDLFERGLRLLCRDPREVNRPPLATIGEPAEDFLSASRLAAASLFSNRITVAEEGSENAASYVEVAGGEEQVSNYSFVVRPTHFKRALASPLFHNGRWAHRYHSIRPLKWAMPTEPSQPVESTAVFASPVHFYNGSAAAARMAASVSERHCRCYTNPKYLE